MQKHIYNILESYQKGILTSNYNNLGSRREVSDYYWGGVAANITKYLVNAAIV